MGDRLVTDLTPKDLGSSLNSLQCFVDKRIRNSVNTVIIVKVIAVNGSKIDVQTVLKDLGRNGTSISNYTIPDVRYLTWQYGKNAITCVPSVGDVGLLLISKQDTSGLVKDGESICQTRGIFNPGDGIYIGGLEGMNQNATQFIHFEDDKIDITGTGTININAKAANIQSETAVVEATTSATVKSAKTVLDCANINLGGENGKAVALHGDQVKSGSTVVGTIVASSTTTKAV